MLMCLIMFYIHFVHAIGPIILVFHRNLTHVLRFAKLSRNLRRQRILLLPLYQHLPICVLLVQVEAANGTSCVSFQLNVTTSKLALTIRFSRNTSV
ncbi:hypothetical protein F5Y12DRAFT_777745 [Xylaria sp. FL1777]|nr:hypothetical protein F5Y12DRAFT_777745 [Xylaria sp. FL1777]